MSEHHTAEHRDVVSRPPTEAEKFFDRGFRGLTFAFAWLTLLVVFFLVLDIAVAGHDGRQLLAA